MNTGRKLAVAVAIGIIATGLCFAQDTPQEDELETLKSRITELERLVREQQQVIAGQNLRPSASAASEQQHQSASDGVGGPLGAHAAQLLDRLNVSGAMEVEAGYGRTKSDTDKEETSDITLATVELEIEAEITDWIKGTAVFLWEEDGTEPVDLDIATISLGNLERFPFSFEIGKFYVPFGRYDSAFITDPMTLEIGETRESAARLGFGHGPLQVGLSVFNGDVDETGSTDNHLENIVLDASLEWQWENGSLALGAAYTSHLAESDGLQDAVMDNAGGGTLDDRIGAAAAWATVRYRRISLSAEYLAALDDFEPNSLSFGGPGNDWAWSARPRALNLEAAYQVTDRFTLAAKYEAADDTFDWLPERRYGGCVQYVLHEGKLGTASVALEYLHGTYDDADDTHEDTVTLQLGLEF